MGEIFFLLWLADVVGNLQGFAVLLGMSVLITGIGHFAVNDCVSKSEQTKGFLRAALVLIGMFAIVSLMAVLTPSSTTIRLMAGRSAASQAIQSPLGQKTVEAVDAVLSRVIKEAKKE